MRRETTLSASIHPSLPGYCWGEVLINIANQLSLWAAMLSMPSICSLHRRHSLVSTPKRTVASHLEKRRVSDSAVPWKMSMAMLSRPSCPSRLFRKPTSEAARLPLLLTSAFFGALVGLPGSTCGHKRAGLQAALSYGARRMSSPMAWGLAYCDNVADVNVTASCMGRAASKRIVGAHLLLVCSVPLHRLALTVVWQCQCCVNLQSKKGLRCCFTHSSLMNV